MVLKQILAIMQSDQRIRRRAWLSEGPPQCQQRVYLSFTTQGNPVYGMRFGKIVVERPVLYADSDDLTANDWELFSRDAASEEGK